ncbi:hypothetical protein H4R19_000201 [Coemansia spiralis]|nr:hypothetical protein H4R19_000201 [Coemansia spiralis]
MRRSRNASDALSKPFKSPARATAAPVAATDGAATVAEPVTPTRPARTMRPLTPGSAPPLSRLLARQTPQRKPLLRVPPQSAPAAKRHKPSPCDPAMLSLAREKGALQRQLAQIRQEVALVERCLALQKKSDKQVVDTLVAKWQTACSRASDDLFELLKPAMEAQRQSAALGFGPQPFDSPDNSRPAAPHCGGDSGDEQQQKEEEAAHGDRDDEDIDIPYMLKRFGIDPDLF